MVKIVWLTPVTTLRYLGIGCDVICK